MGRREVARRCRCGNVVTWHGASEGEGVEVYTSGAPLPGAASDCSADENCTGAAGEPWVCKPE